MIRSTKHHFAHTCKQQRENKINKKKKTTTHSMIKYSMNTIRLTKK